MFAPPCEFALERAVSKTIEADEKAKRFKLDLTERRSFFVVKPHHTTLTR
jgi:hypothetical protein